MLFSVQIKSNKQIFYRVNFTGYPSNHFSGWRLNRRLLSPLLSEGLVTLVQNPLWTRKCQLNELFLGCTFLFRDLSSSDLLTIITLLDTLEENVWHGNFFYDDHWMAFFYEFLWNNITCASVLGFYQPESSWIDVNFKFSFPHRINK